MTLTPEQLREAASAVRDAITYRKMNAEDADQTNPVYWQNELARAELLLAQLEGRDEPKAEKGVNPSGKVEKHDK